MNKTAFHATKAVVVDMDSASKPGEQCTVLAEFCGDDAYDKAVGWIGQQNESDVARGRYGLDAWTPEEPEEETLPEGWDCFYWEDQGVWAVVCDSPIYDGRSLVRPAGLVTTVYSQKDAHEMAETIADLPNQKRAVQILIYTALRKM